MFFSNKFFFKNFEIISINKKRFLHKIKDLFGSYEKILDTEVELIGWIRSVKKQKLYNFIHINDGSDTRNLQAILSNNDLKDLELLKKLNYGASIKINGKLVKSTHAQQSIELLVRDIVLITQCEPKIYPFEDKKVYDYDFLRKYNHLRSNTTIFACILRARNHINNLIHKFFQKNELIHVHTPIITLNNCEGGCDVFEVNQMNAVEKFFIKPAYLTSSAQLHLEVLTNSLGNVYTISPTFRSEKSQTRHHLAEFYMIEAELINMENLEQLLDFVENLVKYVCLNAFETISHNDLDFIYNYLNKDKKKKNLYDEYKNLMKNVLNKKFIRLSYDDAIKLINDKNCKEVNKLEFGNDLSKEHEQYIVKHFGYVPVFIINYPKSLKPFYMRENMKNKKLVENFDLLVHDIGELVGGSLRESNYEVLLENMKSKNMKIESFEMYLETKKYGAMHMGGFGIGFERLIQYILKIDNIKDVCAFPRYWNNCKM